MKSAEHRGDDQWEESVANDADGLEKGAVDFVTIDCAGLALGLLTCFLPGA